MNKRCRTQPTSNPELEVEKVECEPQLKRPRCTSEPQGISDTTPQQQPQLEEEEGQQQLEKEEEEEILFVQTDSPCFTELLPAEVQGAILDFAFDNTRAHLLLRSVCRIWNDLIFSDERHSARFSNAKLLKKAKNKLTCVSSYHYTPSVPESPFSAENFHGCVTKCLSSSLSLYLNRSVLPKLTRSESETYKFQPRLFRQQTDKPQVLQLCNELGVPLEIDIGHCICHVHVIHKSHLDARLLKLVVQHLSELFPTLSLDYVDGILQHEWKQWYEDSVDHYKCPLDQPSYEPTDWEYAQSQ